MRNLTIGFLLALCLLLNSGYTGAGEVGRYACSGDGELVTVIDTKTGHIWQISKSSTVDWGTPQDRDYRETFVHRGE